MDILGDVEAGFTIFRISWRISTIFSMGLRELPTYLKPSGRHIPKWTI
jgi:hypothetical protein